MTEVVTVRDESAMIAAILAGDKRQFHDLIRPFERSVYLMAFSLLRNEAEAEEVAQEAFLRAFRSLASFRAQSKFSTWLISITLNEARTRLRRSQRFKVESLDAPEDDQRHITPALLRDWREVPSEAVERSEVRAILRQAIEELPTIYREVFMLRDVEEMSVNEIAEAMNLGVSAVKVRLHRARLMLQKRLAPELKSRVTPEKRRWRSWF
ncbi:RNA polymerase sigma factor [Edaphobacter acidisoli]|uniref:RNA polymerase sigma factor n=1 Tax=Edaphobacter acidisoli TaxID=2040573 RepID=A0A916W5H4_9BACT|nr:sigma-70 family RNA polymerase sigma factor [Edaphobacter acidisoli]GGA67901.1 RNA polymerase sigma factor [Edaphobacter acidisoli]